MPTWLPVLVSIGAFVVTVVGLLLADKGNKTRTDAVANSAKEAAKAAADEAKRAHDELAKVRESMAASRATAASETEAVRHDLDRLTRDKADVSVVAGIQVAIVDVKAEMIRQFDRLESRLEQTTVNRPRSRK